jgi:amidophosphoribosyltransferase
MSLMTGNVDVNEMTGELSEKCAVAGVWGDVRAARMTRVMLEALQHRGQDATGIVAQDANGATQRHAALGLVATAYSETILDGLTGSVAIGHNRYATSSGARDLGHMQPFVDSHIHWSLAHNGNLSVIDPLVEFLGEKDMPELDALNDSGMIHAVIGHYLQTGSDIADAVTHVYPLLIGAFSCVAIENGKLIAFRDSCGIRPLSYGRLPSGGYAVASETRALDALDATEQADVLPGQLIIIDEAGVHTQTIAAAMPKLDIFELVYFARGSSRMCGRVIEDIRHDFGTQLARECPLEDAGDTTIVVPVPRSAIPAAQGYALESGLEYVEGIQRTSRLRTFIRPNQESRKQAVREKLVPDSEALRGKRVVLVEDSIVRGTTLGVLIQMVREAGASEVHVRISSPPVKFPNFYGINMPSQQELVAHGRTNEEICDLIGADSLGYLSVSGMLEATRCAPNSFDTSVFTGEYPVDIGMHRDTITMIVSIEASEKIESYLTYAS